MPGSEKFFVEEESSTTKPDHTSNANDLRYENDTILALEQLEQFMNMHPFVSEPSSGYAKVIWGSFVALGLGVGSYAIFAKHSNYWPFKASPAVEPNSLQDDSASNPSIRQQPNNIEPTSHDNLHNPSSSSHPSESSAQIHTARGQSGLFSGHSEIGSDASTMALPVFVRGRDDVSRWLEENDDAVSAISATSGISGMPTAPVEISTPFTTHDENDPTALSGTVNTNSANTEVS